MENNKPDLFEQISDICRNGNEKMLRDNNIQQLKADGYKPCAECGTYSFDGVENTHGYFCDENCVESWIEGVKDSNDADMYDMYR